MKRRVLSAALIAFGMTTHWSDGYAAACSGEPWLEIEVRALEMAASQQLIESTSIDVNGCVESQFARFDIRAGHHQRQLSSEEFEALEASIQSAQLAHFDAEAISQRLRQPRSAAAELNRESDDIVIIGGDQHRLTVFDGTQRSEYMLRAAEQFAEQRPDIPELVGFSDVVIALRGANADPRKPGVKALKR